MAARIRADRNIIVCAAKSEALPGDCYLNDDVHYTLAVELRILHCNGRDDNGADLWEFRSWRAGDWGELGVSGSV